ncbi:MAG: methyltransferase domain-containing protein [Bacteroidota bacterium]
MISFSQRSNHEEIMDDLNCSGEVVEQTLKELDIINKLLGGNPITIKTVVHLVKDRDRNTSLTIVDMGCGSGDMLRKIYQVLKGKGFTNLKLIGIDANPNIIEYAKQNTKQENPIQYVCEDVTLKKSLNEPVDLIISTLFTHHFSQTELISLLKHWKKEARLAVVINDLHRNRIAYYSIKWLTAIFSKSSMVKNDGPLSVLRGFSKSELKNVLKKAELDTFELAWKWAFRWKLIIY